jgi:hypothetical protein
VTQPESVRRQIEEATRLHQEAYQQPAQPEQVPQVEPEQQQAPDSSGQVHDWKLRFTNYKASADREIATLRQGVGNLQAQLQSALTQLDEVRKVQAQAQSGVVPSDLLSAEEKDMLGEENLAIVAKVADAKAKGQVAELQGTVRKLEEQLAFYAGREQKRDQKAATQTLQQRLTAAYANWEKVDADPGFAVWMGETDPLTGQPRAYFFRAANQTGDVQRLAAFYREYGEKVGSDPRESLLTPPGRASAQTPVTGRIWSQETIRDLYAAIRRGQFQGKDQERRDLEADLFAAQRDGRVRG